jgi:hypothetical protein
LRAEAANQVGRDLGDAPHAEQRHVAVHLLLQQAQSAAHTRLAFGHRGEQERSADEDELSAKCERFEQAMPNLAPSLWAAELHRR